MSATFEPDPNLAYRPGASFWPIMLSDWKRSNATVTVTLRSGVQLGPGKVNQLGGRGDPAGLSTGGYGGYPEHRWDFDLTEVVAIEAVAPR